MELKTIVLASVLTILPMSCDFASAETKATATNKDEPNPLLVEALSLLRSRDRLNIANPDLVKQIQFFQAVNIDKPWSDEVVIDFPSFKGSLKEDAQAGRKEVVQRAVRIAYNRLLYLVAFNPQFEKLLDSKVPLRLPYEAAESACSRLHAQLKDKFDMELDSTYWIVRLKGGGSANHVECPYAVGLDQDHDDDTVYLRDLLKDKFIQYKLAQHLLATAMKVDVARVSDKQIKLTVALDLPKFFKDYKFKALSDLVEQ